MPAILGIDAAWTPGQPSGVALFEEQGHVAHCLALAPSYSSFFELAAGREVAWNARRFDGSTPEPARLLAASRHLLDGREVDLIPVDMPVSKAQITGRRCADDAISRAFGAQGCSTHTPNEKRPGPLGAAFTTGFASQGYGIATSEITGKALVEVYPHPALLRLLSCDKRVQYKVSASKRYWPEVSREERIERLLNAFDTILRNLSEHISGVHLKLPAMSKDLTLSSLKRYEDAIDALICSWVGIKALRGEAMPYGNETAAIWVPC